MVDSGVIRTRPLGASTTLGKRGFPVIKSATGGEIQIATGVSEAGFNPVDLMYASLAACMAMSVRVIVTRLGLQDQFEDVSVEVTGVKTEDKPTRVERFNVVFNIRGNFDDATRKMLAETAEMEVCTVSNTMRSNPEFNLEIVTPE